MLALPDHLRGLVENMSSFQRAYCEYRAKGLSQSVAAGKAGSEAQDNAAKGRVGYAVEQMPGVKEYILHLQQARAEASVIDGATVIAMMKKVYDAAMLKEELKSANTAVELIGKAIGLFDKQGVRASKVEGTIGSDKPNTDAFRDGEEDDTGNQTSSRIEELQKMLKDINLK